MLREIVSKLLLWIYLIYIISLILDLGTTIYGFTIGHTENHPWFNIALTLLGGSPTLITKIGALALVFIMLDLPFVLLGYTSWILFVARVQQEPTDIKELMLLWFGRGFVIILWWFMLLLTITHIQAFNHNIGAFISPSL